MNRWVLLVVLLGACAAPPREPPRDLSVEPVLLEAWRRVEAERRRDREVLGESGHHV